jgi:hypothetical protein
MFIYTCIHVYVDAAGDVQLEKPQAEERTREVGGNEEGGGNAERG